MAGRRVWAALQLLDRQLVAHEGRLAGCVDDLELTASEDGNDLYVTAILSGPGALTYRLGRRRLGRWLRRVHAEVVTADPPKADPDDPTRIPFNVVTDIGSHVALGIDAEQAGTASVERWVRDHIVDRIPGSRHASE
jgi:hypothetical protein